MPVAPLLKSQRCSNQSALPLYHQVPKTLEENLLYRQEILERAAEDKDFQQQMIEASSEDILFWVNTFAWTYDPRQVIPKLPFITYPEFQDNGLLALDDALGNHDVLIEKSRDMGASWMCLTVFYWRWLFRSMQSFLMVSRKEALVDGAGDSLFAHIDFLMKGTPTWMVPTFKRNKLKLYNLDNGSRIEGESTTDNLGRGGRRTALLIDEFAAFDGGGWDVLSATADNTNTRLFNSTPHGTSNAFYAQRQNGTPRLRFHGSAHPDKGFEKYQDKNGRWRSPWYDNECIRRAHPVEIATQLDIDYQGSAYPFFDTKKLDELRRDYCREPDHVGTLHVDPGHQPRFEEDDVGPLKLWVDVGEDGEVIARDYVIGADISQGTGASESALVVGDRMSGEKVAELCSNQISAHKFAELAVALCRMFSGPGGRGAYLIWEATGPGRTFGKSIIEDCHYGNIYFATKSDTIRKRITDKPGWFSTGDGKRDLLSDYRELLFSKRFINPSFKSLEQAGEFIFLPNGKIEHGGALNTIDPSDKGDNHGDVVIADALVAKILKEREQKPKTVETGPPVMSFAWRRREYDRELAASEEWK